MTNLIDEINAASLRDDIPAFRPGDTLKVHICGFCEACECSPPA